MLRRKDESRRGARRRSRTVLIYCGGARTERGYFDGLKAAHHHGATSVLVRGAGVAPDQLVRVSAAYRDRRPGVYDEVWCVADVDEFDVHAAVFDARRNHVNLAISNPCFELWLLLHHADCRSYCSGCTDAERRLKKHVPHYDKTKVRFRDFEAGVSDAVERAKNLDEAGEDWRRNPLTSVWVLVERLLEGRS